MRFIISVWLLFITTALWSQPGDSLKAVVESVKSSGPSVDGMLYIINPASNVLQSFLVRDVPGDSVNVIINGKKHGPHLLYEGASNVSLWGLYSADTLLSFFVEDDRFRKKVVSSYKKEANLFDVDIAVSEKTLRFYDQWTPDQYIVAAFQALSPGTGMHIVVHGDRNLVLCEAYGFITDAGLVLVRGDSSFCRTVFYNGGSNNVVFHNRYNTSKHPLPPSTYLVFVLKKDSVGEFHRDNNTSTILTKTIYYENGSRAIVESSDSLVYFNRRNKPTLGLYKDSLLVFRKNGSREFLLKRGYRCYSDKRGRVISARFGDSLVRYDKAGQMAYYGIITNDSIKIINAGGELVFSGSLIMYAGFSPNENFDVRGKGEAVTDEDVLFLILSDDVLFHHYRNSPERIPDKESLPDNLYPQFYSTRIFLH